jgi:hypothetical protein
MRSIMCLLFMVAFAAVPVLAQENPNDIHQTTAPPPGARFEIIQSEVAAKWTFRLDRFTGEVSQLVKTKAGDFAWEDTEVIGRNVGAQANRVRFQLFTSGIAARYTFLIDTDTGKTWQLTTSKEKLPDGTEQETNTWEPFAH